MSSIAAVWHLRSKSGQSEGRDELDRCERHDLRYELSRRGTTTLVISCTHDKLRPSTAVEPMARQISGAEYLEINTGHFAAIQTPGLVSQAFHSFPFSLGY
jgi:pimeloyl-ACP methyl ester carboxylesterase